MKGDESMDKDLAKDIVFEIDEKKRLGTMRIDWYDGKLCNQWNPTTTLVDLNKNSKVDLKKLQKELNYLQFYLLMSFRQAQKYCGGTGYDKEKVFTISLEYFNFAIRIIPVKEAYSYIYAYIK